MGNLTGSASGSAGSAGSAGGKELSSKQLMGLQSGLGMINNSAQQQEALITQLAKMGPPPALQNISPTPVVGQDIVGKYGANMRPPSVNYRSRQDVQMNPSVGQLLMGG